MSYQSAYQEMLYTARTMYEDELLPELVTSLYESYARALDDVLKDLAEGTITPDRASGLAVSIMQRMEAMGVELGDTLDAAILEAAELAAEGHSFAVQAAAREAGVSVGYSFTGVPAQALELMMVRRGLGLSSNFKTLINRHITDLAPEVDRFLTSAITRGVSAPRAAEELVSILAGDDDGLKAAVKGLRIDPRTRNIVLRGGVEMDDLAFKQAKSLLFDSYRIAVTETNTAFFESDRTSMSASPVVKYVKWTLSGRHFGLSSAPCTCDLYAMQDVHGYGAGIYHPEACPSHPHPFCGCHLSPQLLKPSEWNQPKPPLPSSVNLTKEEEARQILENAAQKHRGKPRTITPRHLEVQMQNANQSVQLAYETAQQVQV